MQVESLEVLDKAAVPPAQARAIVRAIEIEIAGARDVLATKHDLGELRQDLRQEIAGLGMQLRKEMGDLRAEMHATVSGAVRQMFLAVLGQTAVMLGFGYFLVARLH
jgi:hypothetical protein